MDGSLGKKSSYALFVAFLLVVWLIVANLEDVEIAEESQKLKESASEKIKESTQKIKERYIDDDENISGKLKEDILDLGDKFEEGVEKTADIAIEKSKEAGQKILDEGKNIVTKVSDIVDPEEVVNVGFSKAINLETQVASHRINVVAVKNTVNSATLQKMGIELSCDSCDVVGSHDQSSYRRITLNLGYGHLHLTGNVIAENLQPLVVFPLLPDCFLREITRNKVLFLDAKSQDAIYELLQNLVHGRNGYFRAWVMAKHCEFDRRFVGSDLLGGRAIN